MSKASEKDKYEMDMCSGPVMGKLISFSLPLIVASNLQLLFNAVDIIVVGKFSGSQSLAAVGSTTALINLLIMLLTGILLGASVMAGRFYATTSSFTQTCMSFVSQNYGVKNWGRMRRSLKDCIILSVGAMVVIGLGVSAFPSQILSIYTSSPEAIQWGTEVFLYTTSTYFVCSLMDLLPGAMRGFGCSTVPMILSIIGTIGVRIFWIDCVFPQHRTMDVLFISYPLSWFVTVVMQLVYFYFAWNKVRKSE